MIKRNIGGHLDNKIRPPKLVDPVSQWKKWKIRKYIVIHKNGLNRFSVVVKLRTTAVVKINTIDF